MEFTTFSTPLDGFPNRSIIKREETLSYEAGELVSKLYHALLSEYLYPEKPETLKSLNALCVRLVFCLYAEDAEVFERHQFHDYLNDYSAEDMGDELGRLFEVLNTPELERKESLKPKLAAFPHVNGGLFSENITIPKFTKEIRCLLLEEASEQFNWSEISPTIFGAMFESTINPATRRLGGMHYTSIENIHKVIDPLFLDDLRAELATILARRKSDAWRVRYMKSFHDKLANLKFLDPACGSGNFLTETYLSLRRLENQIIQEFMDYVTGQTAIEDIIDISELKIRVQINQFYGIEINDFAVAVARTALWIAESQMMRETKKILGFRLDLREFLPLKSHANIMEGNALRLDWETVIPKQEVNYIMGNPPFSGGMKMSDEKKAEMKRVIGQNTNGVGEMDYVASWYYKAAKYMPITQVECAFVSTNSIVQGQQAITVWEPLIKSFMIQINFAYRTFKWSNEASKTAAVHCVIVGFSKTARKKRLLFDEKGNSQNVCRINSYLVDAEDWFPHAISKPICKVPPMKFGSMPRGKAFIMELDEREKIVKNYPFADKFIKKFCMGSEFINGKERYCLWLLDTEPSEYTKCPPVMNRIAQVKQSRLESKAKATQKLAQTPTIFAQIAQPDSDYIAVPAVSSERREYVPIAFLSKDIIAGNKLYIIPNATVYHFGVLISSVHMAWMRTLAGRLEMRYSYSKDIVYNNFPWPSLTDAQKKRIEQSAQAILNARAQFPNSTLADLYNGLSMPPVLRHAHQANDKAVMDAYGFSSDSGESKIVAELMRMYQKLTSYSNPEN